MPDRMPIQLFLPCGGVAFFDSDSGISYRCDHCGAVVGSIGMPRECYDETRKWDAWEKLGGQGWDYETGEPSKKRKNNA